MEIMECSASVFQGIDEEIKIPVGHCHGDLTFSNILFNGNNYYLIDFWIRLSSPHYSIWLRLGKIRIMDGLGLCMNIVGTMCGWI